MILIVALVAPFAPVAVVALCLKFWSRERREFGRREDVLVNQLLHAAGKPWQPAPADVFEPAPDFVPEDFAVSPEQMPVE